VLQRCEELEIAFLPWAPVSRGQLAEPGGPLDRMASAHEATPGQVALAWLLARSAVMVPIPGTSSVAHLEENLGAADVELTADELAELEAAAE
jgi:aryl-alcohol dehydrogenase-like predicted oxidoreductase